MTKQTHPEHILAIESNNGDPRPNPTLTVRVSLMARLWRWLFGWARRASTNG